MPVPIKPAPATITLLPTLILAPLIFILEISSAATEDHEIGKYGKAADNFFDRVRDRIRLYADFQPVIRTIAMAWWSSSAKSFT